MIVKYQTGADRGGADPIYFLNILKKKQECLLVLCHSLSPAQCTPNASLNPAMFLPTSLLINEVVARYCFHKHVSTILSTVGGGVCLWSGGRHPPRQQTFPWAEPSRQTPGQTPPVQTPPWADTPLGRHLPWADTSPGQTAPWGDTPPGQTPPGQTPPGRHPPPIRRPLHSCLHMLLLPTTANHTQLRVQDFLEGGRAPTPEVGVLTYFCWSKTAWKWKNLDPGGGASLAPS